ncbi:MAG: hypothetical protein Q9220_003785 [cf. Caloplaca sp. 1 TL-2023]
MAVAVSNFNQGKATSRAHSLEYLNDLAEKDSSPAHERPYNIHEILENDRMYYQALSIDRPPFVKLGNPNGDRNFIARLIVGGEDTGEELMAQGHDWIPGSRELVYYTAKIAGKDRILKKCSGGGGGFHCKIWYGHERGAGKSVVARAPNKKNTTGESTHERDGNFALPGAVQRGNERQPNQLTKGRKPNFTAQQKRTLQRASTSTADRGTANKRTSQQAESSESDHNIGNKRTSQQAELSEPDHDNVKKPTPDSDAQIQALKAENARLQERIEINVCLKSLLSSYKLILE